MPTKTASELSAYVMAWQRKQFENDPVYRRMCYFKNEVWKRRNSYRHKRHFIPLEEYQNFYARCKTLRKLKTRSQTDLEQLDQDWAVTKYKYRVPEKIRSPRMLKPKIEPELRKRNLANWEANMRLCALRKEAKAERDAFLAQWKKKWEPLIGKRCYTSKKATRHRRDAQILATKKIGDHALSFQIRTIRVGPCYCYWCEKYLPNGGTLDHIKPLSKGGTHTSDNVCAACSPCNSEKRDLSPSEANLSLSLF